MKKIIFVVAAAILLTMTGCENYRELNSLNIIAGMAIDKSEDGYCITLEMMKLEGGMQEGMQSQSAELEGATLPQALDTAKARLSKQFHFGNMQIVIISQEVAEEGIGTLLDWFVREEEIRETMPIAIAVDGSAAEILSAKSTDMPVVSFALEQILNPVSDADSHSRELSIYNAVDTLHTPGRTIVLPGIHAVQEGEEDSKSGEGSKSKEDSESQKGSEGKEDSGSQKGSEGKEDSGSQKGSEGKEDSGSKTEGEGDQENGQSGILELAGLAVFKNDKLVYLLPETDTPFYLYAMDRLQVHELVFEIPNRKELATANIADCRTRRTFRETADGITFRFSIDAKGQLSQTVSKMDIAKPEVKSMMEKAAAKELKQQVEKFLKSSQGRKGTDIADMGYDIYLRDRKLWQKVEKNWDNVMQSIKIEVDAKVQFLNSGTVRES